MFNKGDIFFLIHKQNLISKAIAWVMGSQWSHTGLIYEVTTERIYTLETTDFEVTHRQLSDYLGSDEVKMEIWTPIGIPFSEKIEIVNEANKKRGEVYGYLQLISFAVKRFFFLLGANIKNFFRQGVVCCGVVLYGYQKSSIKELHLDPESIDAEELYKIVSQCGKFAKIYEKI